MTHASLQHQITPGWMGDKPQAAMPIVSSLPTDDPEFREIVEEFADRLEERVSDMRRTLSKGDLSELARLAHWLKGTGGSVGFDLFTAPAAALQSSARSGDLDGIEKYLSLIEELTRRIQILSNGVSESRSAGTT